MERRAFLKLVGASAVVAAGGATYACTSGHGLPALMSAPENDGTCRLANNPEVNFTIEVDVLIVGSGIAGLSAAMAPAEAGATVMVIDKLDLLGGESFGANGVMQVSGSAFQRKAGITATAIEAWDERKQTIADEGAPDLEFAKRLWVTAPDWVDHLVDSYHVEFADPHTYVKAGVSSTVLLPKNGLGTMESVMTPLRDGLSAKGVTFSTGMCATAFIQDGEGVTCGMRFVATKNRAISDVHASHVVIATGGFASSQPLIHTYVPDQEQVSSYTYASMGEGHTLCLELDAALVGMDKAAPLIGNVPQACAWGLFGPCLIVDPTGKRFAREDDMNAAADACHHADLGYWWTIFTKQLSGGSQSRSVAQITAKQVKRLVGPFDALEDLAGALSVSVDVLKATFDTYNKAVDNQKDDAFGRTLFLGKLSAPYYALKQFPVRYKSRGGVKVDGDGRLLKSSGSPVAGVYCCGSVGSSSLEGLASNGAFGMLTGQAVAKALDKEKAAGADDAAG